MPRNYQDLDVWKYAVELVEAVYRLSDQLPSEEKYGLTSQIRRAAVSVPANIAEGAERDGAREYLRFLGIATGSLAETETHLILILKLGMAEEPQVRAVRKRISQIGRMLTGLKRSLRQQQ